MMQERERRRSLGLPDTMPTGDESNALAVAHYRQARLADVRARFEELADAIATQAAARSDDEMKAAAAIPWARERALWEFIGGDTFLHWPIHAEAIERAT